MQRVDRHTFRAVIVTAMAAVVLGACTRSEREEVRTETKQVTNVAAGAIDNAALTTKVKAALLADEMVKGTQINVDSNAGVVTLNGAVDSAAHMQRAEQIARGVSGVTRVQNNLNASAAGATTGSTGSTMATTPPPSPPATASNPVPTTTPPAGTKGGAGTTKP